MVCECVVFELLQSIEIIILYYHWTYSIIQEAIIKHWCQCVNLVLLVRVKEVASLFPPWTHPWQSVFIYFLIYFVIRSGEPRIFSMLGKPSSTRLSPQFFLTLNEAFVLSCPDWFQTLNPPASALQYWYYRGVSVWSAHRTVLLRVFEDRLS